MLLSNESQGPMHYTNVLPKEHFLHRIMKWGNPSILKRTPLLCLSFIVSEENYEKQRENKFFLVQQSILTLLILKSSTTHAFARR